MLNIECWCEYAGRWHVLLAIAPTSHVYIRACPGGTAIPSGGSRSDADLAVNNVNGELTINVVSDGDGRDYVCASIVLDQAEQRA